MKKHPEDLIRGSKCAELLIVACDLTTRASFCALDAETQRLVNDALARLLQACRSAQTNRDATALELEREVE